MGIFKFLKELAQFRKVMKDISAEIEQRNDTYLGLTAVEFSALPDEELYAAAMTRTEKIVGVEIADGFAALNEPQKVVYALNYFEMEVNNGGLCQFFVNSSRMLAPYISGFLGRIGAEAHKTLFDSFVEKNGIDLSDLSSFSIRRIRDYEKQLARYPFDDFDNAFYELPSLEEPLTAYIRANSDKF